MTDQTHPKQKRQRGPKERFATRTAIWVVCVVLAAFAPFAAFYTVQFFLGGKQQFWDVIHAGDILLISTAIAAGAAGDLYVTASESTPRWALWLNNGLALLAFGAGCLLFAAVEQAQDSATTAQAKVSAAKDTLSATTEALSAAQTVPPAPDVGPPNNPPPTEIPAPPGPVAINGRDLPAEGPPGTPPAAEMPGVPASVPPALAVHRQLIEAHVRVLDDKQEQATDADAALHLRNTVAWWAFGISAFLGVVTIGIEEKWGRG